MSDEQFEGCLSGFILYSRGTPEDPALLPRTIKNFVIGLLQTGNTEAIDEIHCLIEDASPGVTAPIERPQ